MFPESIKGLKPEGDYSASPKIWEDKAGFDGQDRQLRQGRDRSQGEDQGSRLAEGDRACDRQGMRRLPRDVPPQERLRSVLNQSEVDRSVYTRSGHFAHAGSSCQARASAEAPPSFCLRVRSKNLLRHLTADFAARIGCGVDVDVVLAGHEVGGLRIGQRGAAFDRARCCVGNRNRDAGVLAGFGGAVEMRGGGGAGQAGIGQLPAQLLAGGIVVDVGGAGGGAGVRRAPRTCRRASPSSCRRRRGRRRQRPHPAQAWQAWSCSTWFSPC